MHVLYEATACVEQVYATCSVFLNPSPTHPWELGLLRLTSLSVPRFPYMKVRVMSLIPLRLIDQIHSLNVKYYHQSQVYHVSFIQTF